MANDDAKFVEVTAEADDGLSMTCILNGNICKFGPALSDILSIDRAVVSSERRYLDDQKMTMEVKVTTKRGTKAIQCLWDGLGNLVLFMQEVVKDHDNATKAFKAKIKEAKKEYGVGVPWEGYFEFQPY